jgi:hypothetical protein
MMLSPVDRDALQRAMALARKEPGRAAQLDSKLADGEPWERVAMFAASCCQGRSLQLRPWEAVPCDYSVGDIPDLLHVRFPDTQGLAAAGRVLQHLLNLGLSRFEPDPIQAIAAAEQDRGSAAEYFPDMSTPGAV